MLFICVLAVILDALQGPTDDGPFTLFGTCLDLIRETFRSREGNSLPSLIGSFRGSARAARGKGSLDKRGMPLGFEGVGGRCSSMLKHRKGIVEVVLIT